MTIYSIVGLINTVIIQCRCLKSPTSFMKNKVTHFSSKISSMLKSFMVGYNVNRGLREFFYF